MDEILYYKHFKRVYLHLEIDTKTWATPLKVSSSFLCTKIEFLCFTLLVIRVGEMVVNG